VTLLCFTALFLGSRYEYTMKSLVSQKEKLYHRYVNGVVGLSLSSNEIVNGLASLTKRENKLLA
jgi:hypothetical protein